MPDLEYLLDDIPSEHFPYEKTFAEAKNHPIMVVHTSGSSGLPKPVVWTHWALSTGNQYHLVPSLNEIPTIWGGIFDSCRRVYVALPIFQGVGIAMGITAPCFHRTVTVLGPPGSMTADVLNVMLDSANIDAVNASPSTFEDVTTTPDVLSKLERLKFIAVVGGES
jgi:acyl-CoA synthetase (AMP-forming)/AMP-acid ligase II